jgi:F420-dependent oxidoreductase-like protein
VDSQRSALRREGPRDPSPDLTQGDDADRNIDPVGRHALGSVTPVEGGCPSHFTIFLISLPTAGSFRSTWPRRFRQESALDRTSHNESRDIKQSFDSGREANVMEIGIALGHAEPPTTPIELVELAREAERLGYHSAWVAEAWGSDAVSPLAWLGALTERIGLGTAVMQIPGRTPANTAMTAVTVDLLSGGRFRLGLGNSGPKVVEGWHGQLWGRPLEKLREYVEIVRAAIRRERLEHHGRHYDIPLAGGTGLGKPLQLMLQPVRSEIPIYLAAISPKAVELALEIGDGWLPMFWSPEQARDVFPLARAKDGFDVAPLVRVALDDDVEAARDSLKPAYAFYIGGMGARSSNFYNDLFAQHGYEAEARVIQDLFLDGKRDEAAARVPDAFIDEVALVGPKEQIRDRFAAWLDSGATTLLISTRDVAALRAIAEIAL